MPHKKLDFATWLGQNSENFSFLVKQHKPVSKNGNDVDYHTAAFTLSRNSINMHNLIVPRPITNYCNRFSTTLTKKTSFSLGEFVMACHFNKLTVPSCSRWQQRKSKYFFSIVETG